MTSDLVRLWAPKEFKKKIQKEAIDKDFNSAADFMRELAKDEREMEELMRDTFSNPKNRKRKKSGGMDFGF